MTERLVCVSPSQVNDEDYLAALAHDARPEFTRHLSECAFCRQELAVYRRLDEGMHLQFGFITSPARALCEEAQRLGDYLLGLLSPVEARKVQQHLLSCTFCSQEVAELQTWLSLEPAPGEEADPSHSGPVQPWSWLRRVVATLLTVNQGNTPSYALAGVRGSDEGLPKTYQAEEIWVTLTIQPSQPRSKELMVLGLVQRDNQPMEATAGAEVRLSEGGLTLATETVDDLGNFVFDEVVAPQHFDLEIKLGDKVVLVPNLGMN